MRRANDATHKYFVTVTTNMCVSSQNLVLDCTAKLTICDQCCIADVHAKEGVGEILQSKGKLGEKNCQLLRGQLLGLEVLLSGQSLLYGMSTPNTDHLLR